jgi:hypothetical protein
LISLCSFQEIVPLNAGNVLGTEDNGPAKKWVSLVRRTLNNSQAINTSFSYSYSNPSPVPDPVVEIDADFEGNNQMSNYSYFHRRSFQSLHSRSLRMDGITLPIFRFYMLPGQKTPELIVLCSDCFSLKQEIA